MAAAATPAIAALVKAGVPHEVVKFSHDPRDQSFGAAAVSALTNAGDIAPEQIFKTLVIAVPDGLAVAVVPVPSKLSFKAAAAALGVAKAVLADPAAVQRATGYVVAASRPSGSAGSCPPLSTRVRSAGSASSAAQAGEAGTWPWRPGI